MADNLSGRVAIVDDDEDVLDSFRFMLELAGFSVATYLSATLFLANIPPDPFCLIVDHQMPVMTGLDLVARLRDAGSGVPVVLVTAATSPAMITHAARVGIRQVLQKPAREADLIAFVSSCR